MKKQKKTYHSNVNYSEQVVDYRGLVGTKIIKTNTSNKIDLLLLLAPGWGSIIIFCILFIILAYYS